MIFGSSAPYLMAGTKIICPQCVQPLARLNMKTYKGQDLAIRDKDKNVIGYRVDYLCGRVKINGRIVTLCRYCMTPWHHNGSVFTEKGWWPTNPYPKSQVQSEQESFLSRGPKHFLVALKDKLF